MAGAVGIIGITGETVASKTPWMHGKTPSLADEVNPTGIIGGVPLPKPASSVIVTQDPDKTVQWYCDYLQFEQVSRYSGVRGQVAVLQRSGALLEVQEDEHSTAGAGAGESAISFKLLVENVDQEVHRLKAQGVEILAGPRDRLDHGFRGALIRDVDGRVVGLREPLDE
jgi:catechol 2,3-dioxygenase-like lactoylglutathione lyase family enzyme